MRVSKKAKSLKEISAVVDPTPLEGSALEAFYVHTDQARDEGFPPSRILRDLVYNSKESGTHLKLLFASHPGAGKTTELNRLRQDLGDDFWFVNFSVRDELDTSILTHIELILTLMENLYKKGHEESLIQNAEIIEPVRNWLNEIVVESRISRGKELEIQAGLGLPQLLSQIAQLLGQIKASFTYSFESAQTVRQILTPRIAELRTSCNNVIEEITLNLERQNPKKQLLIIVEDTDKLDIDVARNLFVKNTVLLADLRASIIYTTPLFLVHSLDQFRLNTYFEIHTLAMIKTHKQDGSYFKDGRTILKKIILSRVEEHLILPEALDLAIDKTGGVLRDLLKVIQNASITAIYSKEAKITEEAVKRSLNRLKQLRKNAVTQRGDITTEQLFEKMVQIAKYPGTHSLDPTLQLLLYTQAILEYNGSGWFKLHPIMEESLEEMGLLG